MSGPVPKRSTERRRRNKDSQPTTVKLSGRVPIPGLPKATHPVARRLYNSLRTSGQSQYFEPSDWATALLLAHETTMFLAVQTRSLQTGQGVGFGALAILLSGWATLGVTEVDRRRAHIEVERGAKEEQDAPGITALDDFRKKLQA